MKEANYSPTSKDNNQLLTLYDLLHQRMTTDLEAERKDLAVKLNDQVIQSMLALHIQLSSLVSRAGTADPSELGDILALIADLVEDLKGVARTLRPLEIDTLDLAEVLEQECETFSEQTGIPVTFAATINPYLSDNEALCFLRLLQAALANVYKHAQAAHVWVTLWLTNEEVVLKIEDDGCGLPIRNAEISNPVHAPGLTLFDLMLRFQRLNGRITLQSQIGAGTKITAVMPRHYQP